MKNFCKLLDVLFLVSLIAFVLISVAMLLVQTGALLTLNGELAVNIYNFIVPKGGLLSAAAAIITFVLGYLRHMKQDDD